MYLTEVGRDRKWLAKVCGLNHNTINAMYKYNRWPRLDSAIAIAEGLDLPLDFLITGKERSVNLTKGMEEIVDMLSPLDERELELVRAALRMWFIVHHQSRT